MWVTCVSKTKEAERYHLKKKEEKIMLIHYRERRF